MFKPMHVNHNQVERERERERERDREGERENYLLQRLLQEEPRR